MFKFHRLGGPFWGLAALALVLSQPGAAQDRDTQEVQRYVLTDAALAKYKAATKKLSALAGGTEGACDDADSPTIAEAVAKLDATPGAKAAVTSSGMTSREYIVFTWSLVHNGLAAWAASQPGGKLPPGISQANVDFYRKHAAEMESMPQAREPDCNEDSTEDDYTE